MAVNMVDNMAVNMAAPYDHFITFESALFAQAWEMVRYHLRTLLLLSNVKTRTSRLVWKSASTRCIPVASAQVRSPLAATWDNEWPSLLILT